MLIKLLKRLVALAIASLFRAGWIGSPASLRWLEMILSRAHLQPAVMTLTSVVHGAEILAAPRRELLPVRSVRLERVRRVGPGVNCHDVDQMEHVVVFPPVDLTYFRDVRIVGGSEMLYADNNVLLYDELALGNPDLYGCKAFPIISSQSIGLFLPAFLDGKVLVLHRKPDEKDIPRGIALLKDHATNYYHWLFECLPRAIMALKCESTEGFPLLVDARLPGQNLEALRQIAGDREIILVNHRAVHRVRELVFPGVFSYTHDNYGPTVSANDLLIAPEAVKLVREAYLPKDVRSSGRKLYVARDRAGYRRMRNEEQIQACVVELGFEIVRPEDLSFSQQVRLFSEASVIVGPTGAGLSNMVFAAEGCKVIVFAGATRSGNYFIFGQLAQWLKHDLIYVNGIAIQPSLPHSDYSINMDSFMEALAEVGLTECESGMELAR